MAIGSVKVAPPALIAAMIGLKVNNTVAHQPVLFNRDLAQIFPDRLLYLACARLLHHPILEPEEDHEPTGDVANFVFPVDGYAAKGDLIASNGAADRCVAWPKRR
jgi:hypothetical protein